LSPRDGNTPNQSDGDFLVAAQLVERRDVTATDDDIIMTATARPDPWWRRNQSLVTGVAVVVFIVLIAVILAVILAPSAGTSTTPTASTFGVEALIVVALPGAEASFVSEEDNPQKQALQWVRRRVSGGTPDSLTNTRSILHHYTLATLFFSTMGGTSWINSTGWLQDANECNWHGVTCDLVEEE